MKKYRLKTEAVPFFKDKYATSVHDFEVWEKLGVDDKALEEIPEAYISYGHERNTSDDVKYTSLSGWDKDGTHFHFTIHFPAVSMKEHDKFMSGKIVRGLMDKIQRNIDNFYSDFTIEK